MKDLILEKSTVKNAHVYPIQRNEDWKIRIIKEISLVRLDLLEVNFDLDNLEETDMTEANFDEIIEYLRTK